MHPAPPDFSELGQVVMGGRRKGTAGEEQGDEMCEMWVLSDSGWWWFPCFSPRRGPSILLVRLCYWCRAWPRAAAHNTRADLGREPQGIHREAVGSRPSAASVAPLDSGPGCQPGVRGGEGILAMSWSHGPEAGNKEEGNMVGTASARLQLPESGGLPRGSGGISF